MYHTYFFIRKLSAELSQKVQGMKVLECFSQNKDELIIALANQQEQLFIKCALSPELGLISFQNNFSRARKNSIDLFSDILDKSVLNVKQVAFDRSFYFELEGDNQLLFKLHGRRSNVLLYTQDGPPRLFRKNLHADVNITIDQLAREINLIQPDERDIDQLKILLGKNNNIKSNSTDEIIGIAKDLLNASGFLISTDYKGVPEIKILGKDQSNISTHSPIEASNLLAKSFSQEYFLNKEKNEIRSLLNKKIKSTQNYIQKATLELDKIKNRRSFEEIANIVMANLHILPDSGGEKSVFDFYQDQDISIKIKPGTSPQRHAENLYRKAKNQKIELIKVTDNIEQKLLQQQDLQSLLSTLDKIKDFKELKLFKKQNKFEVEKIKEQNVPYNEYICNGFRIWVGKNAKANDELTLKFSHKNDLWLHARDAAGSHVLIKERPGNNIPNPVIEYAASLAAYFSKRRTDSLCPVIFTPKKFVRKRKGSPPGLVTLDKEQVVMVKPIKPEAI